MRKSEIKIVRFLSHSNFELYRLKSFLFPFALDFYGSLLKHARKKRGHNGAPALTSPSMQLLSPQGWNVRYELKQAVFSEYRQDIDLAIKFYGIAYESLLEVFKTIPADSSRWNEARALLDAIAFKVRKTPNSFIICWK